MITVAASEENLQLIDTVFASAAVDVSNVSESLTRTVTIWRPSEFISLTPGTVTVQVEIGPVIRNKTFTGLKINVDGCDTSLRSSLSLSSVKVEITGPQLWINKLKSSAFRVSCDVTGLGAGTWQVPLVCTVDDDNLPEEYTTSLSAG